MFLARIIPFRSITSLLSFIKFWLIFFEKKFLSGNNERWIILILKITTKLKNIKNKKVILFNETFGRLVFSLLAIISDSA